MVKSSRPLQKIFCFRNKKPIFVFMKTSNVAGNGHVVFFFEPPKGGIITDSAHVINCILPPYYRSKLVSYFIYYNSVLYLLNCT